MTKIRGGLRSISPVRHLHACMTLSDRQGKHHSLRFPAAFAPWPGAGRPRCRFLLCTGLQTGAAYLSLEVSCKKNSLVLLPLLSITCKITNRQAVSFGSSCCLCRHHASLRRKLGFLPVSMITTVEAAALHDRRVISEVPPRSYGRRFGLSCMLGSKPWQRVPPAITVRSHFSK